MSEPTDIPFIETKEPLIGALAQSPFISCFYFNSAGGAAWDELRRVEVRFLRHCFSLSRAERQLALRSLHRERGSRAVLHVERERQRLGRDLHTGVGQMLAAIRLQAELLADLLPGSPEPAQNAVERIAGLAANALDQVRSISHRLHPPEWRRLSLDAAIRQLWELSGIPNKFTASLRADLLPHDPAPETAALIYRAAQEAFSNAMQHARARRIEAALQSAGGFITLVVQDDGVGFDVPALMARPASLSSGIGLRSIRELAAGLGGSLVIESGPGGTRLEVSAPLAPGTAHLRMEKDHAGTADHDDRIG